MCFEFENHDDDDDDDDDSRILEKKIVELSRNNESQSINQSISGNVEERLLFNFLLIQS